jgi:hypothetical protein
MKGKGWVLVAITLISTNCLRKGEQGNIKEAYEGVNHPGRFDVKPAKLKELSTEGTVPDDKYPWTDDYWGTYKGGIANRWQVRPAVPNSSNFKDYMYKVMTKEEVLASKEGDLDNLSPAEKYDILMGRYDYPLTTGQWNKTFKARNSSGLVPTWFGICHGWAPATIAEPEPGKEAVMTNADGIQIKFYSSDIKALMSQIYAELRDATFRQYLGTRCNTANNAITLDETGRILLDRCRDVNPGALHLVLAEYLGNEDPGKRRSFVADVTRQDEVWNQPVTGYKSEIGELKFFDPAKDPRAAKRAEGTKYVVSVTTKLYYVKELAPARLPRQPLKAQYTKAMTLSYDLELDQLGTIIGGEWKAGSRFPDFIWRLATPVPADTGYLSYGKVREILDTSLKH